MSDPRLSVKFAGLHKQIMTVKIDNSTITYGSSADGGSTKTGYAVRFSADGGEVELVGNGEFVLGKLLHVESDNIASVQYHGAMTLPAGSGLSSLTLGKQIVGDLDGSTEGYVRTVDTNTAAELGRSRGFVIDDSDLTAVIVFL